MKNQNDPVDAIRRFLGRRIESIEQLDVLLLLHRESARFWNASTVARSLRLGERSAADCLEVLARQSLLDVRIASDVVYRFSPATPALALEVQQVADAYAERRHEVIAFVTSRRRRSLRDFSDAFRVTKESDDG